MRVSCFEFVMSCSSETAFRSGLSWFTVSATLVLVVSALCLQKTM